MFSGAKPSTYDLKVKNGQANGFICYNYQRLMLYEAFICFSYALALILIEQIKKQTQGGDF